MRLPSTSARRTRGLLLASIFSLSACSNSNSGSIPDPIGDLRPNSGGLEAQEGRLALDEDFATRGWMVLDEEQRQIRGLSVDPFDRLLVAGRWAGGTDKLGVRVQRLEPDGRFDSAFGRSGRFLDPYPGPFNTGFWQRDAAAICLDGIGRILVAGQYGSSPNTAELVAWRLRQDGVPLIQPGSSTPDWLRTTHAPRPTGSFVAGAALDSEERMLILSHEYSTDGSPPQMRVTRCATDGGLDRSFGDDGVYRAPTDIEIWGADLVCDDADGVLVCGRFDSGTQARLCVLRLTKNGRLDPNFGAGGYSLFSGAGPAYASAAQSLCLDRQGRILVLGHRSTLSPEAGTAVYDPSAGAAPTDILLLRLDGLGKLDGKFGEAGVVQQNIFDGRGDWADLGHCVTVDSQDRIWVVGSSSPPNYNPLSQSAVHTYWMMSVLRLKIDGRIDESFAGRGYGLLDAESLLAVPALRTPLEVPHHAVCDGQDRLLVISGSRMGTVLWRLK